MCSSLDRALLTTTSEPRGTTRVGASDVDAVLTRLVSQFASPYDFLRELAQNSMDAGSDRVEVTLEMHPLRGGEAVFELSVLDTGVGMD